MQQIMLNLPDPVPQSPTIRNMLLVELVHMTFETWFIRQFQLGLLPEGNFSIIMIRQEYLALCWKEEFLWKEWTRNAIKE